MFEIKKKYPLNKDTDYMAVYAPKIAAKALPGQFVIIRANETAERIPLTIADANKEEGTISVIFQKVGRSTKIIGMLKEGDFLLDFVGPLGTPSELEGMKKVAVIGGGLGCAIAYPQAKFLYNNNAHVDVIAGFRSKELVILENEMKNACSTLHIMTDDGSYGSKGLVTDKLKELIDAGANYDAVIAIGPIVMMKFVSLLTAKYGIKTIVSMNPIMIDGTGMCGGCRVTVDGKIKFACIDGPDFDGHLVDFDELIRRNRTYIDHEREADCRLMNMTEA